MQQQAKPLLILGMIAVALMIGFRFEVGGDWNAYMRMFSIAGYADFGRALARSDPGYQLVNWVVQQLGGGIWTVNLFCGAVFSWGLYRLAKAQPDPWLAVLVAVPYLIIVVAMGYSRQAVAIGFLMAGLAKVQQGRSVIHFFGYVAIAALFHKTAVVVLLLVLFTGKRNRLINIVAGIAAFILLYDLLLAESMDRFYSTYIEAEYNSEGAAVRIVMNLVPALLFLSRPSLFSLHEHDRALWRYFSLAAVACAVALMASPSSTVVDRIALYITPIQLVVLSRLGGLPMLKPYNRLAVVLYSFLIQWVWLTRASNAEYWLPYQIFPF